ncbi:MAG: Holliday junction branch migration protein RuvA [Treponemataceae bacterium]|nr:Holliday junction branch migration protein RuvA [Treponemataceae bacterium]
MFNSLSGTLTAKFPRKICIDTTGSEWDITVPENELDEFPPVGAPVRAFTWLQHTEGGMELYGFAKPEERLLFFDLMKVDGIGAKAAVKILGSVSAAQLAAALNAEDISVLEKIQGIGKKTAAKMLLALKGRLSIPDGGGRCASKAGMYGVVAKSLCDMGYERKESEETVARLARSFEGDAEFAAMQQTEREDFLFRQAVLEMAR